MAEADLTPLDIAATNGHAEIVQELIHQLGIEGCGGASGGVDGLGLAARHGHVNIISMLTDAGGVVHTGEALNAAARPGCEASVKFLLRQQVTTRVREGAYTNTPDRKTGGTPLLRSIASYSPRIARLLVDAGAEDTASVARTTNEAGAFQTNTTPLAYIDACLREKKVGDVDLTEEEPHRLEAVRRLLLRVAAVHAVSWTWPSDAPDVAYTAAGFPRAKAAAATPTTPRVLRWRTAARGVPSATLFR